MPIREVSFNRSAIKDYRDARIWYAERSGEVAARFIDAVDEAIQRMMQAPDSLPVVVGKYRRVPLEKFPHSLIYYQRTDSEVRIGAIAHPSRRPGYWRRRT